MKTAIIIGLGELEPLARLYCEEMNVSMEQRLLMSKFIVWCQQRVKKEVKHGEQTKVQHAELRT